MPGNHSFRNLERAFGSATDFRVCSAILFGTLIAVRRWVGDWWRFWGIGWGIGCDGMWEMGLGTRPHRPLQHIPDHARRRRRRRDRRFFCHRERGGVLDAGHHRRVGRNHLREQFVTRVTAIEHGQSIRFERAHQFRRFGVRRRGDGRPPRHALGHVEMPVQLAAPMVVVRPQRPGQPRARQESW